MYVSRYPLKRKTRNCKIAGNILKCLSKASYSSRYLAGAKATGAGVDVGRFSVDYRLDALYIGLESTV